jgi:hypothetical protein
MWALVARLIYYTTWQEEESLRDQSTLLSLMSYSSWIGAYVRLLVPNGTRVYTRCTAVKMFFIL